jgi:hypothetical protein
MSKVVKLHNARDWKYFDKRLTELRVNDVANIIERGRVLIEAKTELEHGSFEATVSRHFAKNTAHRLMTITRHPVLSNVAHAPLLPPSWMTLYELTKIPNDVLLEKLKDGTINPKMERNNVMAIRDQIVNPERHAKLTDAIKAEPMANQREAAKKLDVSLGVYQRTRRRLIEQGEIDVPKPLGQRLIQAAQEVGEIKCKEPETKPELEPKDLAQLRAEYLTAVAKLAGKAQRDELRCLYRDFLFSISVDEQVEDMRQLIKSDLTHWKVEQFSKMMELMTLKFRRQ